MSDSKEIVSLIDDLFYDSKHFLLEAKTKNLKAEVIERYHRAVVLFAWAGFEGWINKTCADFASSMSNLSVHEKAFLTEKKVEIRKGRYSITNSEKYEATDEKMEFLLSTIANSGIDKSNKAWQGYMDIKKCRDALVHPKIGRNAKIDKTLAEKTLNTLVFYINLLSTSLYKKRFKI